MYYTLVCKSLTNVHAFMLNNVPSQHKSQPFNRIMKQFYDSLELLNAALSAPHKTALSVQHVDNLQIINVFKVSMTHLVRNSSQTLTFNRRIASEDVAESFRSFKSFKMARSLFKAAIPAPSSFAALRFVMFGPAKVLCLTERVF